MTPISSKSPSPEKPSIKERIRRWLEIDKDFQNVGKDIASLSTGISRANEDIFALFHTMPFTASILKLTAADLAKLLNPSVMEGNALIPLLTTCLMAARQGHSSFQVQGELSDIVRLQLKNRGFTIEEVEGSNNQKGVFILWT